MMHRILQRRSSPHVMDSKAKKTLIQLVAPHPPRAADLSTGFQRSKNQDRRTGRLPASLPRPPIRCRLHRPILVILDVITGPSVAASVVKTRQTGTPHGKDANLPIPVGFCRRFSSVLFPPFLLCVMVVLCTEYPSDCISKYLVQPLIRSGESCRRFAFHVAGDVPRCEKDQIDPILLPRLPLPPDSCREQGRGNQTAEGGSPDFLSRCIIGVQGGIHRAWKPSNLKVRFNQYIFCVIRALQAVSGCCLHRVSQCPHPELGTASFAKG